MESMARRESTGMNISLIRGGSGRVSKGGELSVKMYGAEGEILFEANRTLNIDAGFLTDGQRVEH